MKGSSGFIKRLKGIAETLILLFIDITSVFVIFKLSIIFRVNLLPFIYSGFYKELPAGFKSSWWILLVWIFFFYYEGLFTKRFAFWDEIKALWKASFFSTAGVFTIVSIGKLSTDVSRTVIFLMFIIAIILLPLIRIGIKKALRGIGLLKRRVLIMGAGETGMLIAKALKREPNYGYKVVGFLDDTPDNVGKSIYGIKIHKGIDKATNYIKNCNIQDVFIAMPCIENKCLKKLVNDLQHNVERVLFVPDISGLAVLGTTLHNFFDEQTFALEIRNNLEKPLNIFIKRCFDFIIAGLSIPFLSIPILIIFILIKFDSEGPIIFSQERIGKNGRSFRCYKFRTMYTDAEERIERLLATNDDAKKEWNTFWKLKNDPRVTRIGRFLRRTSLDELPQLFNVLKGDMSLVGPRPYLPNEVRDHKLQINTCFYVLPGITGLWQVSGRSNTSYEYRIALDTWYVRNWNLWLDIIIILKTFKILFKKEGAY